MKSALPHLRAAACALGILALGTGARAAASRLHAPAPTPAAPVAAVSPGAPALAESAATDPEAEADLGAELRIAVTRAALATGDAPGTDSPNVPRPSKATRLLDTTLDRTGTRLRIYSTEVAIDEVRAEVLRGIASNGFTRAAASDDPGTASYQRGSDFVVVRFSQRESRSVISVMELGFRTTADSPSRTDKGPF